MVAAEPLVSVIIPAHNGGAPLAGAIRSVLGQTYRRLELIVVDDASTDETPAIIGGIVDPRLRCIRHPLNQGGHAARLTGVRAAAGDIVAFLDQDDLFHEDRLKAHVAFLREHPETGFTYNPHFTLLDPPEVVVGIWRPPSSVALEDLVLGFPITPSVWVMRREWALRDEVFDASTMLRGSETLILGRLLVSGCRFSMIDRTLSYRRVHAGRHYDDPVGKCREEIRCQRLMIEDTRCPDTLGSVRNEAAAENCLTWASVALTQADTEAGVLLLREAQRLDPALASGERTRILQFLLSHAVRESTDAAARLRQTLEQLPSDLSFGPTAIEWAVREAHLIAGAQHAIWDRALEAEREFRRAAESGTSVDTYFVGRACYDLWCYAHEFGDQAEGDALRRLADGLSIVARSAARHLRGAYELAAAFRSYSDGQRGPVPARVIRAFLDDRTALANRGAWSILVRSLVSPS
jgi:hypothetical protein